MSVTERCPSAFIGCFNGMPDQDVPEWYGRSLIEKNPHRSAGAISRRGQALLGMVEDRDYLFTADARKPLEKIINGGAAFQVFEQRAHWHPGVFEHPFAADTARHPLNGGTKDPIEHMQ